MVKEIKKRCEAKGINSLRELELKAGLRERTIYKWDEHIPAADKLAKVAKILGTTVEELLCGE